MKNIITAAIFLFILSPATLFTLGRKDFSPGETITVSDRVARETINNNRGLLLEAGMPNFVARLFANKVTYRGRMILIRIGNTFEPHYLFFSGAIIAGCLYLSYLPLMLAGIYYLNNKLRLLTFICLIVSLLPAGFVVHEYNTFVRLPALFILCTLAGVGLARLIKIKPKVVLFLLMIFIYEYLRFLHDYLYLLPAKV